MAKWKREKVGAIFKGIKNDDGTTSPDALIFEMDANFKKGDKLQLETKTFKEQNVAQMVQKGIMSEETAEKAKYVISKMSDKIRADVVLLRKQQD